jgi:hypothetical protein
VPVDRSRQFAQILKSAWIAGWTFHLKLSHLDSLVGHRLSDHGDQPRPGAGHVNRPDPSPFDQLGHFP